MKYLVPLILLGWIQVALAQSPSECGTADSLINNFQFQEAEVSLNQCLQSDSNNLLIISKLAYVNRQLGQLKKSLDFNLRIIELEPNNRKARMQLGQLYDKNKQFTQAIEQYAFLINLDITNSYFHKKFASYAYKMGNIQSSISHYQKAISLNESDLESYLELAKILHEIKQTETSISILRTALFKDTSDLQIRYELAKVYYRDRNYKEVVYHLNKVLDQLGDTNLLQRKILGVSYFQVKEYEKAVKLLVEVVENSKDNEVVHYYIAQSYKFLGDAENSKIHFEKAIQEGISKNLSNYYTQLALLYEEEGNHRDAITAFQNAYSYSREKVLLYHLARNYDLYYKDKDVAMRYYEKYLEENDSSNVPLQEYSAARLSELKQIMHFDLDSLN